jgi:hypothetical protein
MRKHRFAVPYRIDAKGTIINGTVNVSTADNTRWDVVFAAAQAITLKYDFVLPTQINSWVLNYMRDGSYVYCVTPNLTCTLDIQVRSVRPLKSTDIQICLGKYIITPEGTYL